LDEIVIDTTDEEGRFSLDLGEGTFNLLLVKTGYKNKVITIDTNEIDPDREIQIQLEKEEPNNSKNILIVIIISLSVIAVIIAVAYGVITRYGNEEYLEE
jgi:hypothetical protein